MATMPQQTPTTNKGHFGRIARRDMWMGYLFISPYLIIAGIFTFGLLFYALYTSFTNLSASFSNRTPEFVGFTNYLRAFQDGRFLNSLANIVWYALIVTAVQTVLSVLLANLLNSKLRGLRGFRTFLYAPSVASSVVIALIFNWLFLPTGYINFFLGTTINWLSDARRLGDLFFGLFGANIQSWPTLFRGPSVAWTTIMSMAIFTTIPTFMVMFLAALQDIPVQIYEAADLDGASGWKSFWYITLPLLRPVFSLVVVLGTIGAFQVFDQVSILTQGGPLDTTQTPAYYIYQKTIGTATRAEAGYAASMAFILATIIVVVTLFQRRFIDTQRDF